MVKRKQTVLESSARDRNWLLGRLKAAEKQFNSAIWDALEYADTGYRDTCRKYRLPVNQTTVYTYQRAASSMIQDARAKVNAHFQNVKFAAELSRDAIVEPTQDFSPTETERSQP